MWYDISMVSLLISRQRLWFLLRYALSGGTGAIIQLLVDVLAVEVLGLHYQWGVVSGFLLALVVVFSLQKYWTFKEYTRKHIPRQFSLYTLTAVGSLIANSVFMHVFVEYVGFYYLLAHTLTIGIVAVGSFLVNNYVIFHGSRESIGS